MPFRLPRRDSRAGYGQVCGAEVALAPTHYLDFQVKCVVVS